jgi:curved DNA-binding protein
MTNEFKDYYRVLGVGPEASEDDIKKAFRLLARRYHPDVAADKAVAEEKFKEINEAFEVLRHAETRVKFDALRRAQEAPRVYASDERGEPSVDAPLSNRTSNQDFHFSGTGFSDFFEQFFGGGHRNSEERFRNQQESVHRRAYSPEGLPRPGRDLHGDLLVTLAEVFQGGRRKFSLRRASAVTGEEETRIFQIRIPKGVRQFQLLRVKGQGGAGHKGGRSGNLVLRVRYAADSEWQVKGSALEGEFFLTPWEAVLGFQLHIPALDGALNVKIPRCYQNGQRLRVRGRGLPLGESKRGDLILTGWVSIPPTCTKEELLHWEALAAGSTFRPRAKTSVSSASPRGVI